MLSVIIPIYNVEPFLQEALSSLENQDLVNVEFLMIVDGATDSSAKIAASFEKKDSRFKLFIKENEGYGKTCNYGMSLAKGDYIAIFEPDDYVLSHTYRVFYNLAHQYNVDILRTNFMLQQQMGHFEENPYFENTLLKPLNSNPELEPLTDTYLGESSHQQLCFNPYHMFSSHSSIWANLYKISFLKENNIQFLETPGASFQDYPFHMETMTLAKRILFYKKAYYFYRIHDNNSSSKGKKKFMHVDIFQHLLEEKKILNFVDPKLHQEYFLAFTSQYIWWLNKNRSLLFVIRYIPKMVPLISQYHWQVSIKEEPIIAKMLKAYKQERFITQLFYTLYVMFIFVNKEHHILKQFGIKVMPRLEKFLSILKIIKKVNL